MSVFDRDPDDQIQVLDADGELVGDLPDLSDSELVALYRHMRLARHFDERAVNLQRQGRMGTYPPLAGQEAAQVGSAMALDDGDWIAPSYREHAAVHVHGLSLSDILLYWMGHGAGGWDTDANVLPAAVPIATQIPHTTGLALASKLRGEDSESPRQTGNAGDAVACAYFGDGATSEGDFHEGLNMAGVFDVPAVFVCNNNGWAISVPRERQTASPTLAGKAAAYGIDGVQVDGMDPLATYAVTRAAVEKARTPGDRSRPTLIEAVQYRFGAHTTADDPTVYRDEAEVEAWRRRDPIPRLERFLRETGRLDDDRIDDIEASIRTQVTEAIDRAEDTPRPNPDRMFADVYAEQSAELRAQQAYLHRLRDRHGDDAFLKE
ncbi:pyruvate dehydrogenase (acetyl-transferring) E1 component subunit alpha [Haloplanus aerogenes]|uniref:Pyruvate dehydrogenase (Acetyl-transferring) E1 component subunit alpha n=1 Tax=Haloplanus aerogenes TaxID=660522 RepID=A0A3G8R060_9EURY|nr:pyruvate dehydrogenase (acetyl-transferring) E1 component subunit alpha [Haloplanus aerogenes]AZH27109.1 pyruvate dehydrogenase (acetyl-transferring) E1 component subunit alpha [Haloplanus aerogenes]